MNQHAHRRAFLCEIFGGLADTSARFKEGKIEQRQLGNELKTRAGLTQNRAYDERYKMLKRLKEESQIP